MFNNYGSNIMFYSSPSVYQLQVNFKYLKGFSGFTKRVLSISTLQNKQDLKCYQAAIAGFLHQAVVILSIGHSQALNVLMHKVQLIKYK